MQQSSNNEWTTVVDDECRFHILASARAAYENACSLIIDAKTLFDTQRFPRAGALAILAEEEYAKAFVLCICARDRRWDSAIFRALTDHGAKQAISQGMLTYWKWLQTNLQRVAELNRFSFVGIQPAIFPSPHEWDKIVKTARTSHLKNRKRDKIKQRFFYVGIGREGKAIHRPSTISNKAASECIDMATTFKAVTEIALTDQIPQFESIAI